MGRVQSPYLCSYLYLSDGWTDFDEILLVSIMDREL